MKCKIHCIKCYTIGWIICKTFSAASSLQCNTNFKKQIKITLMRKVILTMAAVVAIASASFAQSGKNQLGVGAEVAVGTGEGGGTVFGGSAKYLHGVGSAGQVTLTAGVLFDSDSDGDVKVTGTQIPLLFGYRHNFNGLYVEPQVGYMRTSAKVKIDGEELVSGSDGTFAYGIGGGYAFANGLDLGVSYRSGAKTGYSGAVVFRVGFNFSLGGR
jgi:hypothetical protein